MVCVLPPKHTIKMKHDGKGGLVSTGFGVPDYFDDSEKEGGVFKLLWQSQELLEEEKFELVVIISHVAMECATKLAIETLMDRNTNIALELFLKKDAGLDLKRSIHLGHPLAVRLFDFLLEQKEVFKLSEIKEVQKLSKIRNNYCHKGEIPTKDEAIYCYKTSNKIIHKLWLIQRAEYSNT